MKTLYIECNMGAAGDMLMAALLEICPQPDVFLEKMNALGLPGVHVSRNTVSKCGIQGTGISVKIDDVEEDTEQHQHAHSNHHHDHKHDLTGGHAHDVKQAKTHAPIGLTDMKALIQSLPISESVQSHAVAVYELIADAEALAHGVPVQQIHFHEVGSLDAVTDIVGVCLLMEMLAPERVISSPVHVGSGHVKAAHGILPVPAPATAHILKGVPFYSGVIQGELCTPTGAALLKHFAHSFSSMPTMIIDNIGYGMGKKDFEAANCVRTFWGETTDENDYSDNIVEISCNLDDMTSEAVAYAAQILLDCGALDVFSVPIYMKKNRSAYMLVCLCSQSHAEELALLMLKNTSTNGVRQSEYRRYKLKSEFAMRNTPYGQVRVKISSGYGLTKSKPEYEDVIKCAREHGVSFETVYRAAICP